MQKQFEELKSFLDKNKVAYIVFEHEPVYTSEQAAIVRNVPLKTGVKALVFKTVNKTEKNRFILALVSADKKVDAERLTEIVGSKIRLASPDEVLHICRCEIGSIHPFGNLFKLKTYMDKRILENEEVNFNAGLHTISIRMRSKDLLNLIKPVLGDFYA
jgi:Ala-tRNA(Pro) deacylase